MAPSIASSPTAASARISSSVEMPPEATTGKPATSATWRYAATSMPVCMPSRAMSVYTRCLKPSSVSCATASSSATPAPSRQPFTLTWPSRAAISATSSSPKPCAATSAKPGSVTSTVPSAIRRAPKPASSSMRASERTPPPTSTDRPSTPQIALIAAELAAHASSSSPKAADRSTTCTQLAPCSANERATAMGSSEYTLQRLRLPRSRRTTLPSIRSIAGNRIIGQTPRRC